MKKIFLMLGIVVIASACHTIYFEKGDTKDPVTSSAQWHHGGGILGLFEFSPPYDPAARCSNGWTAVKTDKTFVTGLVSNLVPYGIYTPWAVSMRCAN